MSKKTLLYFISGILVLSVYSYALIRTGIMLGKVAEKTEIPKVQAQIETAQPTTKYIVKEYNGAIHVFVNDMTDPERLLNIDIEGLRKVDRERFKEGITLNTLEELAQLEEDFSS